MENITNHINRNNPYEIDFNKVFSTNKDNANNSQEYEESSDSYGKEDTKHNIQNPQGNDNLENKLKIESKGIKSIRARVTNIYDELERKITVEDFLSGLCEHFG